MDGKMRRDPSDTEERGRVSREDIDERSRRSVLRSGALVSGALATGGFGFVGSASARGNGNENGRGARGRGPDTSASGRGPGHGSPEGFVSFAKYEESGGVLVFEKGDDLIQICEDRYEYKDDDPNELIAFCFGPALDDMHVDSVSVWAGGALYTFYRPMEGLSESDLGENEFLFEGCEGSDCEYRVSTEGVRTDHPGRGAGSETPAISNVHFGSACYQIDFVVGDDIIEDLSERRYGSEARLIQILWGSTVTGVNSNYPRGSLEYDYDSNCEIEIIDDISLSDDGKEASITFDIDGDCEETLSLVSYATLCPDRWNEDLAAYQRLIDFETDTFRGDDNTLTVTVPGY